MTQICCAGANCICVMFVLTLTVNTEYYSLSQILDLHILRLLHIVDTLILLYPTMCAWATWSLG